MIYHDVEQNTDAWLRLRLGIPTASSFDKILTPAKLQKSKQAEDYMWRKVAEWIYGRPIYDEQYSNRYMEYGKENEDKAIAAYECLTDVETAPGGFWTIDSGMAGCSPDRMVGDEGILEIKCPASWVQVKAFFKGIEADHIAQLQGQLWITGRQYVDVYSYEPQIQIEPKRIYRDEKFIQALQKAVNEFIEEMLLRRADIEREAGPFLRGKEPSEADLAADSALISEADLDQIIALRERRKS